MGHPPSRCYNIRSTHSTNQSPTTIEVIFDTVGYDENGKPVQMKQGQIGFLLDFAASHGIEDGVIMVVNAPTEAEANILVPAWAIDKVDRLD